MIYVRKIDKQGFFIEDAFVEELNETTIETICPQGFYRPKWNGTEWVEGMTPEEITAFLNPLPTKRDLKAKLFESDSSMARIAEDLISTLIAKSVISETDLPESAREKITERQALRSEMAKIVG